MIINISYGHSRTAWGNQLLKSRRRSGSESGIRGFSFDEECAQKSSVCFRPQPEMPMPRRYDVTTAALTAVVAAALFCSAGASAQVTCFGNSTAVMTCLGRSGPAFQVDCFGPPQYRTCRSQSSQFSLSVTPANTTNPSASASFQLPGVPAAPASDPAFGAQLSSATNPAFGTNPPQPAGDPLSRLPSAPAPLPPITGARTTSSRTN
jgi:hypothetical protein